MGEEKVKVVKDGEKGKEKKEKKRRIQLGGGTLKYFREDSFGADG